MQIHVQKTAPPQKAPPGAAKTRTPSPEPEPAGSPFLAAAPLRGLDFSRIPIFKPPPPRRPRGEERAAPGEHAVPPIVHEVVRSAGQPLAPAARAAMEPLLGHDFSQVRIHADAPADRAAAAVEARAFTSGHAIVFAAGEYAPQSEPGRRLLAHELAHVVQQRGELRLRGVGGGAEDEYERQADAVASAVVQGRSAAELLGASAPHPAPAGAGETSGRHLQRQPKGPGKSGVTSTGGYKWTPSAGVDPKTGSTPRAVTSYREVDTSPRISGTKTLEQLQKEIDGLGKLTGSAEAKFGTFISVELNVTVPIVQVPGLSVIIEFTGEHVLFADGEQELELKLSVGVEWSLYGLISFSGEVFHYLKLEGKDLGAAFLDAIKQIVRQKLIEDGVEAELFRLITWPKLSTVEKLMDLGDDWLQYNIKAPVVQIAKLMSSDVTPQQLRAVYRAYLEFFKNNEEVGFEVGSGVKATAEVDAGDWQAEASAEASTGYEDVGRKSTHRFVEVAYAGAVKSEDENELNVRLSKRWRSDGSQVVKFELEGEFRGNLGLKKEIVAGIKVFLRSGTYLSALQTTAATEKEGGGSVDVGELGKKASDVIPILIPRGMEVTKLGLDLSIERETKGATTTWKAAARLKEIGGFDAKSKKKPKTVGAELSVKFGTFLDISAEIQSELNKLQPGKTASQPTGKAATRVTKPSAGKK